MNFLAQVVSEAWGLLVDSSVYILFGLLVSGLLRIFLSPGAVAHHFGKGRFRSVFKAALLGIPIPLCSCGVLPAAVSLRKQGANNGATTAFLISTPESGADSIAITYALMDPIMTVARPVVAFITAAVAGVSENLFGENANKQSAPPDLSCPVDGCCDGKDCPPEVHNNHHSFMEKAMTGVRFAMTEVWDDIVAWFLVGLLLAGFITAAIPDDVFSRYLGEGLPAMLLMLAIGIPMYICATASTPIAAALILKGVSPGAALVFLLAGPATNMTSLTVLLGVLGKRGVAIYFSTIAIFTVLAGLALNQVYAWFDLSARAMAGQSGEIIPGWAGLAGALILLAISIKPMGRRLSARFGGGAHSHDGCGHDHPDDRLDGAPSPEAAPGSG